MPAIITVVGRVALTLNNFAPVSIHVGSGALTPSNATTALVTPEAVFPATVQAQQVGADVRLHVVGLDSSLDAYDVREWALVNAGGDFLVVYGDGSTLVAVKAGGSHLHLALDVVLEAADVGSVTIGDTDYLLPAATETTAGIVELATEAEVAAGTDPSRVVTVLRLKERTDLLTTLEMARAIASIAPLSKWASKTAHGGYAGTFRGVASHGSSPLLIVLVGASGEVQVSLDGHTFLDEAPGLSYSGQYNAIARIGSSYIACTDDGEIHRRTDAPSWSKLYINATDNLYCVESAGATGLVGGDDGASAPVIMRGTDATLGGSWDTFSGSSSTRINAAAHSGALWCAVGETAAGGHEFLALTGSQWAPVASGAGVIADIAYGKGLFVAVGTSQIKTSPDGATWTSRTSQLSVITTGDRIAYNENVGVFIHTKSDGSAEMSLDGITWTECGLTEDIASPSCLGLALTDRRAITVGTGGKIQASDRLPFGL